MIVNISFIHINNKITFESDITRENNKRFKNDKVLDRTLKRELKKIKQNEKSQEVDFLKIDFDDCLEAIQENYNYLQ